MSSTVPNPDRLSLRRELIEREPWLATTLTQAFTDAKAIGRRDSANAGYSAHMLPFFDLHVEAEELLFGGDFYPYGLEQNRHVLEAFLRHCADQRLVSRAPTIAELFPVPVMVSDELDAARTQVAQPVPGGHVERPGEAWRWD